MLTVFEMKEIKRRLGLTNEDVAKLTGVSLSTVQKVLGKTVKAPRYKTLEALSGPLVEEAKKHGEFAWLSQYEEGFRPGIWGEKPDDGIRMQKDGQTDRNGEAGLSGVSAQLNQPGWPSRHEKERSMSSGTPAHQRLLLQIASQLLKWQEKNGAEFEILTGPVQVILSGEEGTTVEPDLMLVLNTDKLTGTGVSGTPEFILEIASPDTRAADYFMKAELYMRAGCREYWIADPERREVTVHDFDRGDLNLRYSFSEKIPLRVLDGNCSIDFGKIRLRTVQ